MSLIVKLQDLPRQRQLRNAILVGIAKGIISETQKAYQARSLGESYFDAPPWSDNSEEWTAIKSEEGRSTAIGFYTGDLFEEVLSLGFEIHNTEIHISVDSPYAEYFDEEHPIIFVPSTDILRDYIAEEIRRVGSDN